MIFIYPIYSFVRMRFLCVWFILRDSLFFFLCPIRGKGYLSQINVILDAIPV
jgi:hypothetical protein